MLSKLWLMVSGGRNDATSMSSDSMSRIEAAYSARFSRWNERRPGFGRSSAAASSFASSDAASASSVASGGRSLPAGGIIPARSFRMIFSETSARCSAFAGIEAFEDEVPLGLVGVVAFQAVLLDDGLVGRRVRNRWANLRKRGCGGARSGRGDHRRKGGGREQKDQRLPHILRQEVYGFRIPPVTGFDASALGLWGRQELLDLPHGVLDFHVERALAELGRGGPGVP